MRGLLEVKDLSVAFRGQKNDEPVVKKISFYIRRGEMLALVGESGSGKSVTALSIMQLHNKGSVHYPGGSILFDNEELIGAPEPMLEQLRGQKISMIFQEPMSALNPLHTIGKQIGEIIRLHQQNHSEEAIKAKIHDVLEKVGLPHFKKRLHAYPHQLSGGERQRVMIAMAIANGPDLLIADEPTTALDVSLENQIITLIRELQDTLDMAVLLITHDLNLVRRFANKVAIMKEGELVERGQIENVFHKPEHAYTKHLLASEPKGTALPLPEKAPEILTCENLKVKFPRKKQLFKKQRYHHVIDGLDLSLHQGETVGIVGESGSGKTTLGLALMRLIKSTGKIVFLGNETNDKSLKELRDLRHKMQFIFQDPFASLNPRMNIEDIIGEGLRVHHPEMDRKARQKEVATILEEVGLETDMMTRYPHEFSGGQRQRISIARAMILKPEVVVLDEPTSALDMSLQMQILELLKKFQKELKTSYLFISHDLRVIKAISHRIIVLKNGQIIEQGTTEELFDHPKQDYTKLLMEAAFPDKCDKK